MSNTFEFLWDFSFLFGQTTHKQVIFSASLTCQKRSNSEILEFRVYNIMDYSCSNIGNRP